MTYPVVHEHANTVTCELILPVRQLVFFEPTLSTTLEEVGLRGIPVSSQLNMRGGSLKIPFAFKVSSLQ